MRARPTPSQRLRPLGGPLPVHVDADRTGTPLSVRARSGRGQRVAQVRECWRVDDEWWRAPVSRLYFEVVLENGRPLTLFHDLVARRWFAH